MPTKLDRVLAGIDPDKTLELTAARVDAAMNSFPLGTAQIIDWQKFQACLADFLCHVEANVLRLSGSFGGDRDHYWSRCVQSLQGAYGSSGEKAAFEMARTCAEGGLYAVLKALATRIAEEYAQNEISARISQYGESLSLDEKLAAATEYLEKFGHLLPSEITEGSAARLRANFPKVLEKHPHLIKATRSVGR